MSASESFGTDCHGQSSFKASDSHINNAAGPPARGARLELRLRRPSQAHSSFCQESFHPRNIPQQRSRWAKRKTLMAVVPDIFLFSEVLLKLQNPS